MTPERLAEIEAEYSDHSGPCDTLIDIIKELMRDQDALVNRRAELAMETLRLEAENDRLRKALAKVWTEAYCTVITPDIHQRVQKVIGEVWMEFDIDARAALAPDKERQDKATTERLLRNEAQSLGIKIDD